MGQSVKTNWRIPILCTPGTKWVKQSKFSEPGARLENDDPLTNDLVEQPDALHPLVDVLRVELGEVGDAGEQDARVAPGLGVQLLVDEGGVVPFIQVFTNPREV